jgi:PBP1b-binding outer membrane lipoprotein LpoB
MKKTYILLALICVLVLSSCGNTEVVETEENPTLEGEQEVVETEENPTLETKQEETMTELTGSVVIDMNHALA